MSVPEEVIDRIERLIARAPALGYRSVSEFVLSCVRRRLEELEAREKLTFQEGGG